MSVLVMPSNQLSQANTGCRAGRGADGAAAWTSLHKRACRVSMAATLPRKDGISLPEVIRIVRTAEVADRRTNMLSTVSSGNVRPSRQDPTMLMRCTERRR